MIDRVLGIVGIALAILFAVLQYNVDSIPYWASATGILFSVLLIGISIGLFASNKRRNPTFPTSTLLRLHISGDHRTSEELESENIYRWYTLKNMITMMSEDGEKSNKISSEFIYINFMQETAVSTLRVTSPDMSLPIYEVKEFNSRFAIIVFASVIPAGTLEIKVKK